LIEEGFMAEPSDAKSDKKKEGFEDLLDLFGAGGMVTHPGEPSADDTPSPADDADAPAP